METIQPIIDESWKLPLATAFRSASFLALKEFLIAERQNHTIYPAGKNIFAAFDQTPFDKVKVIILGQDPYHGPSQAHGLCFSVPEGIPSPPSLVNIFKELESDLGIARPRYGNLEHWASQGVLLLNATLTVRANQAGSHQGKGWEPFTDEAIRQLSHQRNGLVFMLWGRFAQTKAALIDSSRHLILKAAHPSPLSAYNGFFGCRHFSKANEYLIHQGQSPIDWSLPAKE